MNINLVNLFYLVNWIYMVVANLCHGYARVHIHPEKRLNLQSYDQNRLDLTPPKCKRATEIGLPYIPIP